MATRIPIHSLCRRRPDNAQMPIKYVIRRVPAPGFRGLVIVSHDIVGFDTHWSNGRTSICLGKICDLCPKGKSRRWYGWLACSTVSLQKVRIIQFTPAAAGNIDQYFRKHRTLRGAAIDFIRIPAKANGRIYSSLTPDDINADDIPKAPNVEQIILNMMGVTDEQLRQAIGGPTIPIKGVPTYQLRDGDGDEDPDLNVLPT